MRITHEYSRRVRAALRELGVDAGVIESRKLALEAEARRLLFVGLGTDGRDKFLAPGAARAWRSMRERALKGGVELLLVSAFRSLEFQVALIKNKRDKGRSLDEILKVNAPPGYSEHHTGCAVDVGTPGCPPLEEAFEATPAFAWLQANAGRHGFKLSYPRNNKYGYLYEPWHWRWHARAERPG